TDLQEFIPQEAGGTVNLNIGNGGDGTVQFNLRGLLAKETLVLIDGKRVAYGSLGVAGFSGGPDINLIPFSMVDHVDILKDGASVAFLAATGTFPPPASLFLLEDLMPAAEISLAAFRAAACFQACSSVPAVFRSSA